MNSKIKKNLEIIFSFVVILWIMIIFLDKKGITLNQLFSDLGNTTQNILSSENGKYFLSSDENILVSIDETKNLSYNNNNEIRMLDTPDILIPIDQEVFSHDTLSSQNNSSGDVLIEIDTHPNIDSESQNTIKDNTISSNINTTINQRKNKLTKNPQKLPIAVNKLPTITPAPKKNTKPYSPIPTTNQNPVPQLDTTSLLEKKIAIYEAQEKKQGETTNENNSFFQSKKKTEQQLRKTHIQNLETLYKQKKEKSDLKKLIQELIKNYEFTTAWEYIQNDNNAKGLLAPILIVYTQFNILDLDNQVEKQHFKEKLKNLTKQGNITNDDKLFYEGLLTIQTGKYDDTYAIWKPIQDPKYRTIIDSIIKIENDMKNKRDIPSYYKDALVSLDLLKSGYFSLAKSLAMKALSQNEKYILPYQVLAYADFLTNNLRSAADYFQKLTRIDPSKHNSYKYMMGVSYYWIGDYTQAILHLSQIKNIKEFKTDVLRYLILSYGNIDDKKRLMSTYKELFNQNKLVSADYSDFFKYFLVFPYEGTGTLELSTDLKIYIQSIYEQCNSSSNIDKDVCLLGAVGLRVTNNIWSKSTLELANTLLKSYNQNFTLQIIGDYYKGQNNTTLANSYYLKASIGAKTDKEKEIIKNKIISLKELQ